MEEIDATCSHVLAEIARFDREPSRTKLVVQLGVDEVHLPQVRLQRVPRHARPVPDGDALMRVSLHAQPRDETDTGLRRLAEGVAATPCDGDDECGQWSSSLVEVDRRGGRSTRHTASASGAVVPLLFEVVCRAATYVSRSSIVP